MVKVHKWIMDLMITIGIIFISIISYWCIGHIIKEYGGWTITLNAILSLGIIISSFIFLKKINHILQRLPKSTMILGAVLLYIVLYGFSCIVRNEPTVDYGDVYNSAISFLQGKGVDWSYYARCANNAPLFYYLVACGFIGIKIGIQDVFYFMLAINVFLVVMTAVSMYTIVGYYNKEKRYLQIFSILLFLLFLPLWGGIQNMYTEGVTLVYSVGSIACYLRAKQGKIGYSVSTGMLIAVGYLLKPTAVIGTIAFIIIEGVSGQFKKQIKNLAIVIATLFICFATYTVIDSHAIYHQYDNEHAVPVSFWIALGLTDNGMWVPESDVVVNLAYEGTYDEKVERINLYIKENAHQLFNLERLEEKATVNFGNGAFGTYYYQYYGGVGYMLFNEYTFYGSKMVEFNIVYFYSIVIMGIVMGVLNLFKKNNNLQGITWLLSLFGFMVFMMLWESYDKQIFNQMPIIALLGAISMEEISLFFKKHVRKRKERTEVLHAR